MKHNGQRSPEEIQAEIARTRGDMDATLTAIEQRLTPGQLVDQGLDYLRNSGAREFVSNLGGSVKNNPLPVALVGIGLAWLMASGNRKPTHLYEYAESERSGPGMVERASAGLSSAKEQLSQTTRSTTERLSQTAHSARERVGQIGQAAREQMERARDQAERVRTRYDSMMREQPLALGAVGLAIGAILAAAAPRTRQEDRLMGAASDRLTEKAKEIGKEQLEKVQHVASAARDAATQEAQREGMMKAASGSPASAGATSEPSKSAQVQAPGRPNVVEPARATPLSGGAAPRDPRLGTP